MKLRMTGIAFLILGIPLMIYGYSNYATLANQGSTGRCSLDQTSAGATCDDPTVYGVIFVIGLVSAAGGVASILQSRRSVSKAQARVQV